MDSIIGSRRFPGHRPRRSVRRRSLFAVVSLLASFALLAPRPLTGLAAAGDLDPTYGDGGRATTSFGGQEMVQALAIQSDGKLVAGGEQGGVLEQPIGRAYPYAVNFALARYEDDGSLDPTFGDGGRVVTRFPGVRAELRALAIQPDGAVVVAGADSLGAGPGFALVRFQGR
jgi:uncharacterized delta-60 repeat protein